MKLHILNNYETSRPAKFEGYLEINGLKKYLEKEAKLYELELTRPDLEEEIYIFLSTKNDFENPDEPAITDGYGNPEYELKVLNMEEILNHFSYLIKVKTCCNNQTGNYCSVCGKKLK